ncbi:MAG: LacI family transcriptional regulator [Ignavibacteria bacterium]|nr:LacI family transcriptional regulator [Ignavibacteria bacterium]
MGVTIYDLAREAGVGIGTVSRCLNNHPSVSPETRAKVLSVVKRLSYQPHAYAQRLASRQANTISAIIPFFTNHFFVEVLRGVQGKSQELEVDLILYGVHNADQVEYYLKRSLSRGHVDGVMFFSMKFPDSYVEKFQQIGLPVVLVDTHHPLFDSITVRNVDGAKSAVDHLYDLGHRQIAMINGYSGTRPAKERFEGYRRSLESHGIAVNPEFLFYSGKEKLDGFSRESGYNLMKRVLEKRNDSSSPSALFVASDIQSLGAVDAIREAGLRIPEDLALVSFDDIELARHAGLTTMRQPMYEMGSLAVSWLKARMKDPDLSPREETFLPELIIRRSCGSTARVTQSPASGRGAMV